jgi:hypothetical protein
MIRKNERGQVLPTEDEDDSVERLTIAGWNERYATEMQVYDPDGFDRSDPDLYLRLFTEAEWREGAMRSTCRFGPDWGWSDADLR